MNSVKYNNKKNQEPLKGYSNMYLVLICVHNHLHFIIYILKTTLPSVSYVMQNRITPCNVVIIIRKQTSFYLYNTQSSSYCINILDIVQSDEKYTKNVRSRELKKNAEKLHKNRTRTSSLKIIYNYHTCTLSFYIHLKLLKIPN